MRSASNERETGETRVELEVVLDAEDGGLSGATGIDFLDHMLDSFTHHGSISLNLEVSGDEDPHHRTEDVAIVLGEALREAVGDEIARFGDARVPMDEALGSVALDFGGRTYAKVDLPEDEVAGLPVSIFDHFVRSLASSAKATIHLEANGEDMHHVVEAAFKCLGVAMKEALAETGRVRSTKGVVD